MIIMLRKICIGIILLIILIGIIISKRTVSSPIAQKEPQQNSQPSTDFPKITVIAKNLEVPWAIAFLPDGNILLTERKDSSVSLLIKNEKYRKVVISRIAELADRGEGGMLGITIHPDFKKNNYVYVYYTRKVLEYKANIYKDTGKLVNKIDRFTLEGHSLGKQKTILDNIPGNLNHNGGRIKFGLDKMLYIATGDAENPSQAQDKNTLGGKILRVTDTGKPAPGNPFGNLVYSYGHRNVQGLAWNSTGELWATEHGRSGVLSGLDELNFIEPGKNYGWPIIQGDETKAGMETPRKNSGPNVTWAPSGTAFVGNSLFFSGLRGQTLYEAVIQNNQITSVKEHFAKEFGRLREVIVGPDNMLYITTSNRDGRGTPGQDDDKIIRVNPKKLNSLP